MRGPDGRFVRREDGTIFQIAQLAMARTDLPGTITFGNSPQGVYTIRGTGLATNQHIGTVPYLWSRLPIEAPVAGILKQVVPRGTGSVVEPGGLVAEIVPEGATVLADIEVPADRIANVRAGHPVRVQVLTYDPARFGTLDGAVEQVSAASFRRQDGAAFYRVRVALAAAHLGDPARGLAVTPGMTVAADIVTGTQPLLTWLLKPMRNAMDSAFAER